MDATNGLWFEMSTMDVHKQQQYWMRDPHIGNVFLYSNNSTCPGKFLEYVEGVQDDSVSTLYQASQIFNEKSVFMKARLDLINEIAAKLMLLPSLVIVFDEGRQRNINLQEAGTAQLIDILAEITYTDIRNESIILTP
jgi:hypothetical protein